MPSSVSTLTKSQLRVAHPPGALASTRNVLMSVIFIVCLPLLCGQRAKRHASIRDGGHLITGNRAHVVTLALYCQKAYAVLGAQEYVYWEWSQAMALESQEQRYGT